MSVHTFTRDEAVDSIVSSLDDLSAEEVLSTAQSLMREHLSGLSDRKLTSAYRFHFGSQIRIARKHGPGGSP